MSQEQSFEKGLTELEGIVEKLESTDLPLEESIQLFEKGMSLSRNLGKQLDDAERKIEILVKGEDGSHHSEPFEPGFDEPALPKSGLGPGGVGARTDLRHARSLL